MGSRRVGTSSSRAADPTSAGGGGAGGGSSGGTNFGSRLGSTSGANCVSFARELAPSPFGDGASGARSSAVGQAGVSGFGSSGDRTGPAARPPLTRSSRLIGWSSGTSPPWFGTGSYDGGAGGGGGADGGVGANVCVWSKSERAAGIGMLGIDIDVS